MPYYKDINTLFIHIPKTGGTSLEDYLRTKSSDTLFSGHGNVLLPTPDLQKNSLQHQTYQTIYRYRHLLKVPFDRRLKVISIVRNPYHRAISDLFWFKLIDKDTDKSQIPSILQQYIKQDIYDNHNIPQYRFITDAFGRLIPTITVFRTETLTQDLQRYGFTDYEGASTENTYFEYLNEDSIRLINETYRRDFELFHYDML